MHDSHSWRGLWRLSWPLVLAMFLQFSVGLTDAYVAGRFGPDVQGAVGFAGQILFLFNVLANSLGVGLVAMIARAEGARDPAEVRHASRQGVLLSLLVSAPLTVAGLLWSSGTWAFGFLPLPVAGWARELLPFCALTLVPQAVITAAAAVFRARARTGLVLLCWGGTALLNLWWVFAFAFGHGPLPALGPKGITAATAASSAAGAALALFLLARDGAPDGLSDWWRVDRRMAARLWALAWPSGILQMGWQLGGVALFVILGRLPSDAVAATAALTNGLRIEAVLFLPAFALNMATGVLVGRSLGAGDPEAAERAGWRIATAGAVVLTAVSLPVFVWSRELAGLLTDDLAVREATHLYLRFNMVSQPFMAVSLCLGGGLQGAGDTLGTMRVVLGFLWGVRIPLALVLAHFFGSSGVWAAMVASMALQGVGMALRFRAGRWKKERGAPGG